MDPRPDETTATATATATAPAPARNGNRSDPGIRTGVPRFDPGILIEAATAAEAAAAASAASAASAAARREISFGPGGWISIGGLWLEPDPAVSGEVLARDESGIKFGRRAVVAGGIALGHGAVATGGGIALGHGAVATGGGIALGHGASAEDGSVTIGGGVSIVGGGVSIVGGAPPARSGLGGGPRGGGK